MTRIYLIRHCEAMGNKKRVLQGSTDADISELGAKQLECLTKRMKSVPLDRVYASPLIRAVKTAHAVADDKGLSVEIEDGLCELSCGRMEGLPFADFPKYPKLADAWDNHPQDFNPEGGEPMRHGYERIWETVCALAKENEGKTIAAATHGGVLRCLACRVMFGSIEHLGQTPWTDNVSVSLLELDDGMNPSLCFYNDHSHLPEELLPQRNRLRSGAGSGAEK